MEVALKTGKSWYSMNEFDRMLWKTEFKSWTTGYRAVVREKDDMHIQVLLERNRWGVGTDILTTDGMPLPKDMAEALIEALGLDLPLIGI